MTTTKHPGTKCSNCGVATPVCMTTSEPFDPVKPENLWTQEASKRDPIRGPIDVFWNLMPTSVFLGF